MNEFTKRERLEHVLRGFDWTDFTDQGLNRMGRAELREGLTQQDLQWAIFPDDQRMQQVGVRGVYLGNYVPWDGVANAELAAQLYGWEQAQTPFERTYRTISNLDDMHENGIHDYLKYLKFGYGRGTDHAAKDVREGRISRGQAIELVLEYDHVRPTVDLHRWLEYVDIDESTFDNVADSFRDRRVWWQENGRWAKWCVDGRVRLFEYVK